MLSIRWKISKCSYLGQKKSLENKEFFEGDSIFTSRTINRAAKYINTKIVEKASKGKDINLSNKIKDLIDKWYARPYIESPFIIEGKKLINLSLDIIL